MTITNNIKYTTNNIRKPAPKRKGQKGWPSLKKFKKNMRGNPPWPF